MSRGRYERTELTKTQFKISTTKNRIEKVQKQLEEDLRLLNELQQRKERLEKEAA